MSEAVGTRAREAGTSVFETGGSHQLSGRQRILARRWIDLAWSGALAASVTVLVAPFVGDWLRRLASQQLVGSTAPLIVMLVVGMKLLSTRVVGIGRLRYVLAYPPPWVAAWIGFLLTTGYWAAYPPAWRAVSPGAFAADGASILFQVVVIASAVGAACILFASWWTERPRTQRSDKSPVDDPRGEGGGNQPSKGLDAKQVVARLLEDTAIEGVADDWFERAPIADRLARRLATGATSPTPAVAIVGALGSGKTSLRKLVEEAIAVRPSTSPAVRIIPFSAWPFETVAGVVAGMLRAIASALEQELATPVLGALPEEYVQAIEGLLDKWGGLLKIFARQGVQSPEALLGEVDTVATALEIRLILWVEDLERFGAATEAAAESDAVRERLAPVRALLYQLQELRSVSVVVASNSFVSGFDLEKVARYVEVLEPISRARATAVLAAFRTEMLERAAADGVVDPVAGKVRDSFQFSDQLDAIESALISIGKPLETQWAPAMAAVCATPRALKQGLRSCMEIWDEFRGELDFDHVMAASILRHGEPLAFGAIVRLADRLRNARSHSRMSMRPEPSGKANPWDDLDTELGKTVSDDRVRGAVRTIVGEMFSHTDAEMPQGFQRQGRVDYWRRYLSRPELAEETRDQPLLKAIQRSATLDNIVADDDRCAHLEWFESMLAPDRVIRILGDAFRRAALSANHPHSEPPGGASLWRIALDRAAKERTWSHAALAALLREHIVTNVGSNLSLVHAILVWYAAFSEHQRALLRDEDRAGVRDQFVKAFAERFGGDPAGLAGALAGRPDFLLARLVWGSHRAGRPREVLPWPEWHDFAPTIVAAAAATPETMLAPLADLVAVRTETFDEDGASSAASQFLPDVCSRLFGEVDIVRLFRGSSDATRARATPGTPLQEMIELAESSQRTSSPERATSPA
jgi:hypothetical protein